MEFSNSSLLISTKIGFTSPPNLGGSAINFLSILLKKTTPVIIVMNSDCTTSSKRLNCVDTPEIIRMWIKKNLCRKPAMNALYAACGWVLAIFEIISSYTTYSSTFEEIYSSLYFLDLNEAPKWRFSSVVICKPLPWKVLLASLSISGLIMSHDFEASGKYPNLRPNSHNWSHQYFNPGIKPAAVRSHAYATAFDVLSEKRSVILSIINIKGIIAIW